MPCFGKFTKHHGRVYQPCGFITKRKSLLSGKSRETSDERVPCGGGRGCVRRCTLSSLLRLCLESPPPAPLHATVLYWVCTAYSSQLCPAFWHCLCNLGIKDGIQGMLPSASQTINLSRHSVCNRTQASKGTYPKPTQSAHQKIVKNSSNALNEDIQMHTRLC